MTLMQADLEFEYPQKLEKILVKADILDWLDQEEDKLKNIALEEFMEKQAEQKAGGRLIPGDEFMLQYDDYYGNQEYKQEAAAQIRIGEGGMIEKMLSFEEYAAKNRKENEFDNDVSLFFEFITCFECGSCWTKNTSSGRRSSSVSNDSRKFGSICRGATHSAASTRFQLKSTAR